MSLNMCIIYSIIFNVSPLCHYWGSTGRRVRVRPHRRRERDEPETTWHHKHNLSCPQTSTAACYSTAERAAHSQPRDSWMTVLCNKCLWMLCYLVLQSLTVQSNEAVRKRWEKSMGPATVWQWMPVIGPWCPSNISLIPARLLTHTHTHTEREWQRFNDQHLSMFSSVS